MDGLDAPLPRPLALWRLERLDAARMTVKAVGVARAGGTGRDSCRGDGSTHLPVYVKSRADFDPTEGDTDRQKQIDGKAIRRPK